METGDPGVQVAVGLTCGVGVCSTLTIPPLIILLSACRIWDPNEKRKESGRRSRSCKTCSKVSCMAHWRWRVAPDSHRKTSWTSCKGGAGWLKTPSRNPIAHLSACICKKVSAPSRLARNRLIICGKSGFDPVALRSQQKIATQIPANACACAIELPTCWHPATILNANSPGWSLPRQAGFRPGRKSGHGFVGYVGRPAACRYLERHLGTDAVACSFS